MIKYALGCQKNHEFEGWFASSDEFTRLNEAGLLDCPVCGSKKVQKLLMAPSVKSTKGKENMVSTPSVPSSMPAAIPAVTAPAMPQIPAEIKEQFISQLRELKKHVLANSENVGAKFGEEVRKIHYGEAEERGIYGSTSPEEAVELLDEGISILPMPDLPEDKN